MQLAATRPNETVEALAARVYDLGEKPSRAATRAAAKALTEANPFLAKLDDVPPGSVVDVPPLDKIPHRPGATQDEDAVVTSAVLDHVRAAAALLARQLAADLEAELADADATVRLAGSDELRRLETPGLAEALPHTIAAAGARADAARDLRSRQDAVLAQLARDLDELSAGFTPQEQSGT
jgi:hypothetical protein